MQSNGDQDLESATSRRKRAEAGPVGAFLLALVPLSLAVFLVVTGGTVSRAGWAVIAVVVALLLVMSGVLGFWFSWRRRLDAEPVSVQ